MYACFDQKNAQRNFDKLKALKCVLPLLGLRKKHTNKLNFNSTREEQPVSYKPLVYEINDLVSFQHT